MSETLANAVVVDFDARTRLKRAASRLFAERGFRNVTVRELASEAGQRNHGAVGYYFGSKENLAKEILIDGAMLIEASRKEILTALEARGRAPDVRELVDAIIRPSAELAPEHPGDEQYFNRFLLDLGSNQPAMILEALDGRWNVAYQRCLRLLRPLMGGLTAPEKNRRFVFMNAYVGTILAVRESILADRTRGHLIWQSESTLCDVIETTAAILTAPLPPK